MNHLFVWMLCWTLAQSLKLPDYIKPCQRYDPKINDCALKSARDVIPHVVNGDPKYNVPPLDPVYIKELIIKEGTSSVGLAITAQDAYLRGVKDVEIRDLDFNFKDKIASFELYFPEIRLDLVYNVTGRVLLLPIEGYGNGTFTLSKVRANFTYDWDHKTKKDGKEYVTIVKSKLTFDPEKLTVYLENLFHGNKLLGDNMNRFINENWREVLKDVGPVLGDGLGEYLRAALNNIYNLVPYENVFLFDKV